MDRGTTPTPAPVHVWKPGSSDHDRQNPRRPPLTIVSYPRPTHRLGFFHTQRRTRRYSGVSGLFPAWAGISRMFTAITAQRRFLTSGNYNVSELAHLSVLWEPHSTLSRPTAGGNGGRDVKSAYFDGVWLQNLAAKIHTAINFTPDDGSRAADRCRWWLHAASRLAEIPSRGMSPSGPLQQRRLTRIISSLTYHAEPMPLHGWH